MRPLRYRCVAKTPVGSGLHDMGPPVQVHFEPLGGDVVSLLNRWVMFSPVLPRGDAGAYEIGGEYEFHVTKVRNGDHQPTA